MNTVRETNEVIIKTLSEFIEWASQFNDGQYLFRGVPNDTFNIQASAYRRLPEADRNNPSELLRINKDLINEARTLGHDMRNGRQLSDLELLAELQHFRAATCLIDFSRSALNVLWFACQKNPKKEEGEANGKVFAVPCDAVSRLRTVTPQLIKENIDYFFKQDENERYLYQWTPKLQNNRIIAQHSVFLFGGAQIEVAEECVIMQSSKPEILKSLAEVSDITEATMYPDFDGFARLHVHDNPYVKPDAQGLIESGVEAHKRGNLSDAIDYYDRAIERDPNDAIAHLNRGFAYDSKREYDKAIRDFTMAIERDPNNAIAYLNRGFAYNGTKDYDKAIEDFTMAIERDPNNAIAHLNRGFAYNGTEEYDKAIEDFNKVIELDPNDARAHLNRGVAYDNKREYDKAIEDYNKAIEELNKAIERDPNNAFAHLNRGFAYNRKRDYDKAIEDFTMAIELDPNDAVAHLNRGFAYDHKREYDKAIEDYNKAIERDPNNAIAHLNRGFAYNHKREYDKAIEDFTMVIELDPNNAIAHLNRGFAYSNTGDYDKAILDYNKAIEGYNMAIERDPNNAIAHLNRGFAYNRKREYDKAIEDYNKAIEELNKAIERDPNNAMAYYSRGIAWLYLKEWEKARSNLTTAKNMGMDIINAFHDDYPSIENFTQTTGIQLPPDLVALLTPPQA